MTGAEARHWTERVVVPPPFEPVTLAQVKQRLRINHTADDADLMGLIRAARRQVEADTSAVLVSATLAQTVPAPAAGAAVLLMRWPVIEILTVTGYAESGAAVAVPADQYRLADDRPARLELAAGSSWPPLRARDGLTVEYKAGFSGTPPVAVSSLTASGSTFTAKTSPALHGFVPNERVLIAGADQAVYNDLFIISSVPDAETFTMPRVGGGQPPPAATGPVTAVVIAAPEDLLLAVLALVQHWHDPLRSGLTTDGEQHPLPFGYEDLTRERLEWLA